MAKDSSPIEQALRIPPWHIGDPQILLDVILGEVEGEDAKQIKAYYLDAVAATLEANIAFVQRARAVITGETAKG
ncbi:MAG TPA: hypothetical protein VK446_04065 [Methylocystis sp.]|nr:hypothetical protein [Methylocystis sp.]